MLMFIANLPLLTGQSAAVSQKQTQPASNPDAAANESVPKKKRKKPKDNAG